MSIWENERRKKLNRKNYRVIFQVWIKLTTKYEANVDNDNNEDDDDCDHNNNGKRRTHKK